MDYKLIFKDFKDSLGVDGAFSFGLFESLFLSLKNNGVTKNTITTQFTEDFYKTFLAENAPPSLKLMSVKYIKYYSDLMLPKTAKAETKPVEEIKPQTKAVAAAAAPIEKEISDDEDGLYTPPDQIIQLDVSQLPDKKLDEDFLKLIGAVGVENE